MEAAGKVNTPMPKHKKERNYSLYGPVVGEETNQPYIE